MGQRAPFFKAASLWETSLEDLNYYTTFRVQLSYDRKTKQKAKNLTWEEENTSCRLFSPFLYYCYFLDCSKQHLQEILGYECSKDHS